MAQRTRDLRVKFFDPDTLAAKDIPAPGYIRAVAARGKSIASRVGSGEVSIPVDELAKLTGAYTFPVMHDLCVVYNVNGAYEEKIATFVMRSIRYDLGSYGQPSIFKISGPDMMYYLGKVRHYLNIGKEYSGTVMNHNGAGGSSAGWPFIYLDHGDTDLDTEGMSGVFWPKWTLKKQQGFHVGERSLKFSESVETSKPAEDQWAVGDDISIVYRFSDYGQHTSSVTRVESAATSESGYYEVEIADPMTPIEADDNEGGSNPRWYPTFSSTIFKGDAVSVQMQDTNWHTTRISENARYNGFFIENAAAVDILAGANFKWWNSREPNTTNDVELMTENVTGWTINGTASSKGTFHVIDTKGADVLSLLMKTAEATNDFFYPSQASASVPERTLEWKTGSTFAELVLVKPISYGDGVTKQAIGTYPFIHSISQVSRDLPVSIVVPAGGANDDVNVQFNLGNCDETPAAGLLRLHGITALDTLTREYVNGTWRVRNESAAVNIEEFHEMTDVYPRSTSSANITEAANILQARAALILHNRRATEHQYDVLTILPDGKEVSVGQTISIAYADNEWAISDLLYISEYEHFVSNTGKHRGVRQTRLTLSTDGPYPRDTGARAVAKGIKSGISSGGFGVGTGGLGGGNPIDNPVLPGEITIGGSTPTGALTASGLTLTFVIDHTDGLDVTGTTVKLITPTVNLSASTTNSADGTGHTHAINTTADPISNPQDIVATDANSRTGFSGLGVGQLATADELQVATTISLIGTQTINSTGGRKH